MPLHAASFIIGYHPFHPDVSINYQLNRFCDGSPESVAELSAAAPRIGDYGDYTRELLILSGAAYANGRTLAGALYLRSAEFYMLPDDPRKTMARLRLGQIHHRPCAHAGGERPKSRPHRQHWAVTADHGGVDDRPRHARPDSLRGHERVGRPPTSSRSVALVDDAPFLDDQVQAGECLDVRGRVTIKEHAVGPHAGSERADAVADAQGSG
jgi:hypothetical protein